jgi:hypothetical protein
MNEAHESSPWALDSGFCRKDELVEGVDEGE